MQYRLYFDLILSPLRRGRVREFADPHTAYRTELKLATFQNLFQHRFVDKIIRISLRRAGNLGLKGVEKFCDAFALGA
jgi:hypothetical protein